MSAAGRAARSCSATGRLGDDEEHDASEKRGDDVAVSRTARLLLGRVALGSRLLHHTGVDASPATTSAVANIRGESQRVRALRVIGHAP